MDPRFQQSSNQHQFGQHPNQNQPQHPSVSGSSARSHQAQAQAQLQAQIHGTRQQQQLPSLPSMLYSPVMNQRQPSMRRDSPASGGGNSGASSPYNQFSSNPPSIPYQHPSSSSSSNPFPPPTFYQSSPTAGSHPHSHLNQQPYPRGTHSDGISSARNSDAEGEDDPSHRNSNTNSALKPSGSSSKGKGKAATAIKQESNDEEEEQEEAVVETKPKGKLTRVNKACAPCRVKKRRCDGGQPSCSVCNVLNEPCTYEGAMRKRGPKKGPRTSPKDAARTKLTAGLQKNIADLLAKCGEDVAREVISHSLLEGGLDLEELLGVVNQEGEGGPRKRLRTDPHSAASSVANTPNSLQTGKELPLVVTGNEESSRSTQVEPDGKEEEEDELDPDFLATNERGDLMHRGSSSGIGLIHRRPNHSSPLQRHQQSMQSSNLRTSSGVGNNASDSHSADSPPSSGGGGTPRITRARVYSHGSHPSSTSNPVNGPIQIPMAHPPRHGTPRSSPSRTSSPAIEANSSGNSGVAHLSDGALAHRDHILNSLSSGSGDKSHHLSPALRGRALTPTGGRTAVGPTPEMEQLQGPPATTSPAAGAEGATPAVQSNGLVVVDYEPDPILTSEEHVKLFRYYYQGVHPFWPLLYKPALEAIPMEDLRTRLSPVLLYSIYAIASCVVPGDKRAEEAEALKAGEEKEEQAEVDWEDSPGEQYFRCAERYLYDGRLRPDVSAIQACFLLSLYSHGSGELSRAYVFCGLACSMAMDLGLHRFPIHKTSLLHDSVERETRVRLIWHVYILNVMLAAEMGRPVMFRARDCDAPLLNEKEDDEFEKWSDMEEMYGPGSFIKEKVRGEQVGEGPGHRLVHAPSCLNWGVRLFIIVERILSEVHSFRRKATLRKQGNATRILAEIDAELDQWREKLPHHLWLQMPDEEETRVGGKKKVETSSGVKKPAFEGEPVPSFFALDLWLWTATLLLHRPFIPQDPDSTLSDILSNQSHQKSTTAANAICDRLMDFSASGAPVDRLSTDLGYCLFTASVLFFFNSRLPHQELSSDAKERFALCKEWLKKLSGTWPSASAHKQLLDGFATVGEGENEGDLNDVGDEQMKDGTGDSAGKGASVSDRRKSNTDPNGAIAAWQHQQAQQDQSQSLGVPNPSTKPTNPNESLFSANSRNSMSNPFGSREAQEQKQQLIDYYANNSLHRGNGFPGSSQFFGNGDESVNGQNSNLGQMGGNMMNTGWGFDAPASIFDIEHLYWNETAATQLSSNSYAQLPIFQSQEDGDQVSQGFYSGRRKSFQPPMPPASSSNLGSYQSNSNNCNTNYSLAAGVPNASTASTPSSNHSNAHPSSAAAEGLTMLAQASPSDSSKMGPLALPNSNGGHNFPFNNSNSSTSVFNSTSTPNSNGNQSRNQMNSFSAATSNNSNSQQSIFSQSLPQSQIQGQPSNTSRSSISTSNLANQNSNQSDQSSNSPFSFQVEQPGWSDIMSLLQLPPSFNS